MLKKIIQFFLIILSIIIGGLIIGYFFFPQTGVPGQQASNFGGGIVYATIVMIFLWALHGSYKKWSKKKDLIETVGTSKKSALKIIIITTIIFTVLVIPVLYLTFFSSETVTTQTNNQSGGWTNETKASFKEGVLNTCGGKATELCICMADYLIERYSLEELSRLETWTPEEGQPPQEILDATNACFSTPQ